MHSGQLATIILLCALGFFNQHLLAANFSNREADSQALTGQSIAAQNISEHQANLDKIVRLATVYQDRGYRRQAVALLLEARALSSGQPFRHDTELQLAQLYFQLGQYPLSKETLNRVLGQSPAPEIKASALNTLATVQSTLNDGKAASATFREAASLEIKSETHILILTNHLRHEIDHRNISDAVVVASKLSPLASALTPNRATIELKISIADLFLRLSEARPDTSTDLFVQASRLLAEAERAARQRGLTRLRSHAIGHQGKQLLSQDRFQEAIHRLGTAVFLAESVQAYESAYLWQWQIAKAHRLTGDISRAVAKYQTAIQTLEHVRQELITGSPFTYPQKIQPLYSELSDLLLVAARKSPEEATRQGYLQQVQRVLEQSKSAELQDYFQNDCVIPDQTIDLNNVELATAVIYPVILPDRLEVLVNINDQVYQFVEAITSHELERLVNDFRDHLQQDQGDDEYKEIGLELHDLIFAQLEPLLVQQNIDTLLVIPDGTLRTIPFAAIHNGSSFLIERYAIATTPGISLTLPKPLDVGEASLFAGGISDAVQGFSGLPGVPVELARLKNEYGAAVLQDQRFNRDTIQSELASTDYSVVHIATHGHFDSNPQESFLLTYDDRLTMDLLEQSIGRRQLAGNPLELLVLSACETAVGDNRAALGLAGVALKAGARSAIATLWQISDEATVQIIGSFYEQTAKQNQTKAQALQHAQTQLIRSERHYHPTDWAPFLLIGNWL